MYVWITMHHYALHYSDRHEGYAVCEGSYKQLNDMIYLLTAIGLTPGGSSTVHIYTQTVHRTTQITKKTQITTEQHK
jgi:uncharacterized integral membrane protein